MSRAKRILASSLEKYEVHNSKTLSIAIIEAKRKYCETRFLRSLGIFGAYFFSKAEKEISMQGYKYKDYLYSKGYYIV